MLIFVDLKTLISIFIIFTIALRPVLPLLNYAVNYDYIVKNLCENRETPQLMCKGKCYLAKELSKDDKLNQRNGSVKIRMIDVFIPKEITDLRSFHTGQYIPSIDFSEYHIHYLSYYCSEIFHPPLV